MSAYKCIFRGKGNIFAYLRLFVFWGIFRCFWPYWGQKIHIIVRFRVKGSSIEWTHYPHYTKISGNQSGWSEMSSSAFKQNPIGAFPWEGKLPVPERGYSPSSSLKWTAFNFETYYMYKIWKVKSNFWNKCNEVLPTLEEQKATFKEFWSSGNEPCLHGVD